MSLAIFGQNISHHCEWERNWGWSS